MAKDEDKIIGILLGIVGGLALLEILSRILRRKCPHCGAEIRENQYYCLSCGFQVRKQ